MKNKHCPFRDHLKGSSLELKLLEDLLKPTEGEVEYAARQRKKGKKPNDKYACDGLENDT